MKHSIAACILILLLFSCGHKNTTPKVNVIKKANVNNKGLISISETLKENGHLPIEKQIELYYKLKEEYPDAYNFNNEDEMTMYGYSFLWNNEVKNAIEIFKLIVAEFPNSSNPYDSLGEGYMKNGDMELALINYEKSLELNPENFNAEDQIERIKFPNKKPLTPAEKFTKVYTVKEYKDDLDELGRKLMDINPNALKFISKEKFLQGIEAKKNLINENTTFGNFIWHCSEIIASINCSHTSLGGFFQESAMINKSLVFPLQTRWVNGKLFVVDAMSNANKVNVKDEIISINGKRASEIVKDIYKHIPSQGFVETRKTHFFNSWATEMFPYALGFPKSYSVKIKGKEKAVALNKANAFKAPYDDTSIKRCDEGLCLEFLEHQNTVVLTISTFNFYAWNNLDVFEKFVDNSFKKIHKKKTKNLVIDLRFNGGGSPESSIYLLKYLVNKPFKYFTEDEIIPNKNSYKGKLYFIIDGHGESTTGHFMSIAKYLNLGTIVGEELGSNQLCTAGQTVSRLTNTKLVFNVANTESRVQVSGFLDEKGILPEHHITQNIDDYINNIDTVKEYTLNLINKEQL